jgi:hypothetical protein
VAIVPVTEQFFAVPEYESLRNAYPRGARLKKFSLAIYRLAPATEPMQVTGLDIGGYDDPWVLRFFAKEQTDGTSYRWTRNVSYVTLAGIPAESRTIELRLDSGGRPPQAGAARVEVTLNGHVLGTLDVAGRGFHNYLVAIPPDVASEAASRSGSSTLVLRCTTWTPSRILGGPDTRELGVMLDRIRVM